MTSRLLDRLNVLDRRWIFLAMGIVVAAPILLQIGSVESPTPATMNLFEKIESLPEGSRIVLAIDFDPNAAAELGPMALSFTRHCCLRHHKIFLLTLWKAGAPMVDSLISSVIRAEFSTGEHAYRYGEDYVNFGFVAGEAVAISQLSSSFRKTQSQDANGFSFDTLPIMNDAHNLQDMQMVINASGGYPGAKEWVQYAGTPLDLPVAVGCTGVASTQLFPYFPNQIMGLVAGIRGASEYESMLADKYPVPYAQLDKRPATLRGGSQRWAHRLMIVLILLGNGIHLASRSRGRLRHES